MKTSNGDGSRFLEFDSIRQELLHLRILHLHLFTIINRDSKKTLEVVIIIDRVVGNLSRNAIFGGVEKNVGGDNFAGSILTRPGNRIERDNSRVVVEGRGGCWRRRTSFHGG